MIAEQTLTFCLHLFLRGVKGWRLQIANPCGFLETLYCCFTRRLKCWKQTAVSTESWWRMKINREFFFVSVWFGSYQQKKQKALYVHLLELNLFQHDQSCRLCGCLAFSLPHTRRHTNLLCTTAVLEISHKVLILVGHI